MPKSGKTRLPIGNAVTGPSRHFALPSYNSQGDHVQQNSQTYEYSTTTSRTSHPSHSSAMLAFGGHLSSSSHSAGIAAFGGRPQSPVYSPQSPLHYVADSVSRTGPAYTQAGPMSSTGPIYTPASPRPQSQSQISDGGGYNDDHFFDGMADVSLRASHRARQGNVGIDGPTSPVYSPQSPSPRNHGATSPHYSPVRTSPFHEAQSPRAESLSLSIETDHGQPKNKASTLNYSSFERSNVIPGQQPYPEVDHHPSLSSSPKDVGRTPSPSIVSQSDWENEWRDDPEIRVLQFRVYAARYKAIWAKMKYEEKKAEWKMEIRYNKLEEKKFGRQRVSQRGAVAK